MTTCTYRKMSLSGGITLKCKLHLIVGRHRYTHMNTLLFLNGDKLITYMAHIESFALLLFEFRNGIFLNHIRPY